MYDFDLVCVGSGPAGQRAAVQAAKLGRRVAIIEKRPTVGGVCVETGTLPSKTLREAVVALSRLAGKGDRLPWSRPEARPTCLQLFSGIDAVIAREVDVIESQLRRNDVALITGEASFEDPHTLGDPFRAAAGARSPPSTSSSPSEPTRPTRRASARTGRSS